jgi:hypothetical protein
VLDTEDFKCKRGQLYPKEITFGGMPVFPSADAYERFARKARSPHRFIRDHEDQEFFTALLRQAREDDDRSQVLTPNFPLWRAQLGHDSEPRYVDNEDIGDYPCPYSPERMKPLRDRARENRANPKGIPFLYLSNRKETAMSEVRPWSGSLISLARFKPVRDLTIVHCWVDDEPPKPKHRFSTAPPYRIFRRKTKIGQLGTTLIEPSRNQ